jgi:hypothetical protein
MKNQLIDLNNHLFAQLERLGEEGIKHSDLKIEIDRSKAMSSLSSQVVNNARLALDAKKFQADWVGTNNAELPAMIEGKKNA